MEKDRLVSRRGGKIGDDLFVTGRLGGALRHKHLRFVPRIDESRWLTQNFSVHAMIDLSDGLGTDLPRLTHASKVGFKIDLLSLPLSPGCQIDNAVFDTICSCTATGSLSDRKSSRFCLMSGTPGPGQSVPKSVLAAISCSRGK